MWEDTESGGEGKKDGKEGLVSMEGVWREYGGYTAHYAVNY